MTGVVVGDVSKLAADLRTQIPRAMSGVDLDLDPQLRELIADVESAFADIEDEAGETSDDVVASLAEIARDADRIFAGVAAAGTAAGEEIGDEFQEGGEQAERSFDELRRAATRDLNAIQREAAQTSSQTGGRFKAMAGVAIGALAGITAAAAAGLGAITGFGLKAASDLEQTTIGFEALLGSAEAASVFLREVQEFAATTPFEFQGIADASRRILAFGTAVGITRDEVLPTITTIGSLVSVLGGGQFEIEAITRAFGQMASKGKISQEELLQLAEALPGFSANAAIAAGLGVSTAEAMEMITKGEVSAKEGIDLLLKGMAAFPGAAGAMEKQAGTLAGVFSTFKDTVSIALTDAFLPIIPQIKDALTTLTPVIGKAIGALAPAIGQVIEAALPLIGVLTEAFTPVIVPILDIMAKLLPLISGPLAQLGGVVGRLVTAFDPLIQALGVFVGELIEQGLIPALETLIPQLVDLAPAFADALIALVPLIPPLGELLAMLLQVQAPLIELLAIFLEFLTAEAVVPMVAEFVKNLTLLLDVARPFVDIFSELDNWPDLFSRAGDSLGQLGSIIGNWASSAVEAVGGFFADIGAWFVSLPGLLAGWLNDAFHAGLRAIGRGIGLLAAGWLVLPGLISDAIRTLPGIVWGLFTNVLDRTVAIGRLGLGVVLDLFRSVPGRAFEALRRLPGVLWDAVTGAFRRAREGASSGLGRLVSLISEAPGRLRALGGRMFAAGRHLIGEFLGGLKRIGGFVGDVASGIANFIRGRLNSVIRSINAGIAEIDSALPFSLPRIPELARGGLTTDEGLAYLHSREMVLPLQDRRAVDLLADAMAEAQAGLRAVGVPTGGAGDPAFDVRVYLGTREIEDVIDVQVTRRDKELRRRITAGAGRPVVR